VDVKLLDRKGKAIEGVISIATKSDLKNIKDLWKFQWDKLNTKSTFLYKLVSETNIQGLIKLELENEEYIVLKNIEVSPSNYGSKGKFKNVAESLIAFSCLQSFKLNKGNYRGFLVFKSKGELIDYYEQKYGAELIFRERMMIAPDKAKMLIAEYLNIDIEL